MPSTCQTLEDDTAVDQGLCGALRSVSVHFISQVTLALGEQSTNFHEAWKSWRSTSHRTGIDSWLIALYIIIFNIQVLYNIYCFIGVFPSFHKALKRYRGHHPPVLPHLVPHAIRLGEDQRHWSELYRNTRLCTKRWKTDYKFTRYLEIFISALILLQV